MDWVISDELSLTVGHVVGWVSAGAMIIGGVIPYVPQYMQIKKEKNAQGFSLLVCLALLVANTLRIVFWFGKHFEYPLLIQSIIMNFTMFAMIHLCVRVRKINQLSQARQKIFTAKPSEVVRLLQSKPPRSSHSICDSAEDGNLVAEIRIQEFFTQRGDFHLKDFWNWSDFQSYLGCMIVFSIFASLMMYLLMDYAVFVEIVGFLAVFTEAMLGTPQLIKNYRSKSTTGMSITMVFFWTCGDVFKTLYFKIREAPLQFWVCGCIQVTVDVLILLQVYLYKGNTETVVRRGSSSSHRGD